jgi:hypothetical protein
MNIPQELDSWVESSGYSDFVAFTSTFYKDDIEWKVRSEAFFSLLDNAKRMWVQVLVGDGGSGSEFLQRVQSYPNVKLIHSWKWSENIELTMGGERRYAGKKAMEFFPQAKYFLWLEPEKAELMSEGNIDAIIAPMKSSGVDMVVPSRKSKDTLPPQQKAAENRANRRASDIVEESNMNTIYRFRDRYSELIMEPQDIYRIPRLYLDNNPENFQNTNAPYDLWFWPKAFTRESMESEFLPYHWAKWDSIITPVLQGVIDGKKVVDVPVDFSYPPDQTRLESDPVEAEKYQRKRRSQYRYVIKTIKDLVKDKLPK